MRRAIFALLFLAVIGGTALVIWERRMPEPPVAVDDVVKDLRKAATIIATDDPAASSEADLAGVLPLLGDRRVVGLGEATHGTREFVRLKDRLIRALVRRGGFRVFALEVSAVNAGLVNQFVDTGAGDARAALKGLEFWTWQTEEMLELVTWLRSWNVAHPADHVSFVGINAEGTLRDQKMAKNIEHALNERSLASAGSGQGVKAIVWAHNDHISMAPGAMGSYLHGIYDVAYYALGFEFLEGSFRSRGVSGTREYSVGPLGPASYAATLASLPAPMAYVDFMRAAESKALASWLGDPRRSHDIDELFYLMRASPRLYTRADPWGALYDGVIFVKSTTAARGLQ